MVDLEKARSTAAWCFAAVVGFDHGGLTGFRRDCRAVGFAWLLDDGIALNDFG